MRSQNIKINHRILSNRGQSALEYTIIVIIVMAALLTIGNYFKRGLQGRWKSTVDGLGEQYDPRVGNTYIEQRMTSNTDSKILAVGDAATGWWTTRTDNTAMIETKQGFISSGAY